MRTCTPSCSSSPWAHAMHSRSPPGGLVVSKRSSCVSSSAGRSWSCAEAIGAVLQHGTPAAGGRGAVGCAGAMRIHALRTGSVRVKHAFLFPPLGARRQLDLFLPGPWSEPLPIHCRAVEHEGRLLLVDTGEITSARNVPFARFE